MLMRRVREELDKFSLWSQKPCFLTFDFPFKNNGNYYNINAFPVLAQNTEFGNSASPDIEELLGSRH